MVCCLCTRIELSPRQDRRQPPRQDTRTKQDAIRCVQSKRKRIIVNGRFIFELRSEEHLEISGVVDYIENNIIYIKQKKIK